MTDQGGVVVDHMDTPPADIGTEKRDVTAVADIGLDAVASGFGPVLIMAYADEQAVAGIYAARAV